MNRIKRCFDILKQEKRAALVSFIMAGDSSYEISFNILESLPKYGADIIELGMPFTDPIADGKIIQKAALRALASGQTQKKTLDMVRRFRDNNKYTPLLLMGYYNPIYRYGKNQFIKDAYQAGVDGLIVVDLPPEHDKEICIHAYELNIDFIRLITPTTNFKRLPKLLTNASGFLYYVSITGVTGKKLTNITFVKKAVINLRQYTMMPIAVGFGIRCREQVEIISKFSDAVIIGSALVELIEKSNNSKEAIQLVSELMNDLRKGIIKKN
ncbi:Tryptophan synthase alpha chain [Candidatus Johnevansia muelleri]|uniref:Tryptophan synthase alpha chain n=1 Tax=Candidatus Johnevansia muelleri TaxID=1495769 RepID=A0A078KAW0_9GAMM|nr:Tryptophan synthase alpha chain [Candidatus Evansia muelleri]